MKRILSIMLVGALVLGGSLFTAGEASATEQRDPTIRELFEVRWGGPEDWMFLHFPNLVTPVTPDGAWLCLLPPECVRPSEARKALDEFNRYLEELDRLEEEKKEEEVNTQQPPAAGGGGVSGGGAPFFGGGISIGGSSPSGGGEEERYATVGPVEQIRDE